MLVIDVGNTAIKCALFSKGKIREQRVLPTHGRETAAGYLRLLEEWRPKRIALASVVPAVTAQLVPLCPPGRKQWVFERPDETILPHDLQQPETAGIDRFFAARGAWEMFGHGLAENQPLVVVQAGTAVTVDLVRRRAEDGVGCFCGGLILPGPKLWLQALALTAKIPSFEPEQIPWGFRAAGRCTAEAVLGGAGCGLLDAVRGAIHAVAGDTPPQRVVLTGGWARHWAPYLSADEVADLAIWGIFFHANTLT